MTHSSALDYSSQLPVSVCGTVTLLISDSGFSWKPFPGAIPNPRRGPGTIGRHLVLRICLQNQKLMTFNALFPQCAARSVLRPRFSQEASTGILTRLPSGPALAYPLGADSPTVDCHRGGILSLSACGVLTRIVVTYAYICFSMRSSPAHAKPSPPIECSPTTTS